MIKNLPDDIIDKIYKEYVEPEYYYGLYKEIINSRESQNLNSQLLRPYIPILLSKPLVIKYLCEKCYGFRNTYKEHKRYERKSY